MDPDDDHYDMSERTSPRFKSSRSGRKRPDDEAVSDSGSENRTQKKRKTVCKKKHRNDPKSDKNVGFKCSPHLLFDLIKSLDIEQRKWVVDIGFGVLLSMPRCVLPKELTVWLVKQFSWEKKALILRGRTVNIRPHVKKLLGIPDGKFPVPLPRSKRGKSKCTNLKDEEKELKGEKTPRGLSYKSAFETLIASHDPVQFKRSFMLYVLCIYFAPSSGLFLNLSYSPIVSNVDYIKDMNWCDHVSDVLIEGIRDYRDSKAANVNVHGCVHVLLLIYIDMVKSPIINVPQGIPRANHVTSELLDLLDMSDLKLRTSDGSEYGKLELDEFTYADELHQENISGPTSLDHENKHFSGCTSSVHVKKSFLQGIQLIDQQYSESRDRVYAECFKSFSEKMIKIEAERASSIMSLYEKVASLQEEAPSFTDTSGTLPTTTPSIPPSPSGRCSTPDGSSNESMKSRNTALPSTSPICNTPTKESYLNSDIIENSNIAFPVQVPIPLDSETTNSEKLDLVARNVEKPQSSPRTAVTENPVCSENADEIQRSYDLQQKCLQLSTTIVSRAESEKILRACFSFRTGILLHENTGHNPGVIYTDDSDSDDPYLINKKVSAFGKESCYQALKETDTDMFSPFKSCHQQKTCTADYMSASGSPQSSSALHPCGMNVSRTEPIEECTSKVDTSFLDGACLDSKFDEQDGQIETGANTAVDVQMDPDAKPGNSPMLESAQLSGQSCKLSLFFPEEIVEAINVTSYIPDSPEHAARLSGFNVQEVCPPNPHGEVFAVEGSVSTAVRGRAKRFVKSEVMVDGIAELMKSTYKTKGSAKQTYTDLVEKSIFWDTERREVDDAARNCGGKTIIKIRGVHLSEEEFVHTLKPSGQVETNFMWLCSVAIMLEWQSKSRTIMNQTIIKELMKSKDSCDHEKVASKLKQLPLDQIDQLYLPVPNNGQWILILVTLSRGVAVIYDSLTPYTKRDDPYADLWKTIGYNLQISYAEASTNPLLIHDDFKHYVAPIHTNSNLYYFRFKLVVQTCSILGILITVIVTLTACMFSVGTTLEVIRIIGCHNGKDLIGYGKKNMAAYRKEVAHTLVYHRYNDLSPTKQAQHEGEDQ